MNAEQKQQAKQLIADWTNVSKTSTPAVWFLNGDCMAGFLQELVDAHEQKPVAYATGYYAGCLSIATVDGSVLPAGTALYAAPPHQSEHRLEMVNTPAPIVPVEPTPEICAVIRNENCVYTSDDELYAALLEAAPQPPALTDARILEIAMSDDVSLIEDQGPGVRPRITVHNSIGGVYALARAIEREILGGGHD